MQPYFLFNNKDSRQFGIVVNKLPVISRAERNIEKIEVEGKNGYLTHDFKTYKSILKSCECTLENIDNIDNVCSWLDGAGEVIFSNQDNRFFKANIINQIDFYTPIKKFKKFIVQFDCQPFGYLRNEQILTTNYKYYQFYNYGNVYSEPIITVYGKGDINIYLNEETIKLKNVEDFITIDTTAYECYKINKSQNDKMYGEFPVVTPGKNTLSVTGNVTKINIKQNTRFL